MDIQKAETYIQHKTQHQDKIVQLGDNHQFLAFFLRSEVLEG